MLRMVFGYLVPVFHGTAKSFHSFLNIVQLVGVAEPFAGLEFRILNFGIELIHRNNFNNVVWGYEQIEVQRIIDRGLNDVNQCLPINLMRAEMIVMDTDLTFPLDKILLFAIDENSSNQVPPHLHCGYT